MDSNRNRYLQWFTNSDKKRARADLRDASSDMPEIDPFVKSCWCQFPFPKPAVSPIVMTARDLIY